MNCLQHYNNLINTRLLLKELRILQRKDGIYYEGHHIIPRCFGGTGNSKTYTHNNIVLLIPKEHYLAHYLLMKAYPKNHKLISSFWIMCNNCRFYAHKPSARTYEEARILYSNSMKLNKGNSIKGIKPKGLTMLGKKHSIKSKIQVSNSLKEYWKNKVNTNKPQKRFTCPYCGLESNIFNIKGFHLEKCKKKTTNSALNRY